MRLRSLGLIWMFVALAGCADRAAPPGSVARESKTDSAPLATSEAPLMAEPEAMPPLMAGAKLAAESRQEATPADAADLDEFNTEQYDRIVENPFLRAAQNPLSTFSIDVDTASYANVRRFLMTQNMLPSADAVRIEEMVNYFRYADPAPSPGDEHPFAVNVEIARCPWNAEHRLARIGLKAQEIDLESRPRSNLVFLLDVSGSMDSPNKLPLLKRAMRLLVDELGENDRVAIVVYASQEGLALASTSCDQKEEILSALDGLSAGGSTAGAAGIQLAYQVAAENFVPGGINRVILCTDGDFNVGVSSDGELTRIIEEKARSGVFLSVLGFGMGNYKDSKMEKLADQGNGNYAYIDSLQEARKVLVEEMGGTLITVAKDVKIQVDFNPAQVGAYRLIGYENRMLRAEDFEDDKKDAGEIGAGHTVTALYELIPPGKEGNVPSAPESKYVIELTPKPETGSAEAMTVKLRYKKPDSDTSIPMEIPVLDEGKDYADASIDFQFAASVAAFGMILRDSQFRGEANLDAVLELAQASLGDDEGGYRAEFVELVRKARSLRTNP